MSVEDAKLFYEECGRGPAVVLLHDGLLHSVTWDGLWPGLCTKYHVIRYDRRGYGRSTPSAKPYHPEDDLFRVMHQLKLDRATMVGNSSGGALALDFAVAHPEMVDALFLIGPVVHGIPSSEYFNDRGADNMEPLDTGDSKSAAKNWSKDRFLISGDNPQARQKLYEVLLQNPQNLVAGRTELKPVLATVSRLSEIKAPTLVLVGDADIGDVFAYAGAIEAALPVLKFEVWKDNGHLIQLEHPAELLNRFNQFMNLASRKELSVPISELQAYTGSYQIGKRIAEVQIKEGRLHFTFPGDQGSILFETAPGRFFVKTKPIEFEFPRKDGRVTGLVIHNSDGSKINGARLPN